MKMTTSYYAPWALIYAGGQVPGQRPRTKPAWIHEAIAVDNNIVGYRVRIMNGGRFNKQTTKIEPSMIIKTWRRFELTPPLDEIKRVRAALDPIVDQLDFIRRELLWTDQHVQDINDKVDVEIFLGEHK